MGRLLDVGAQDDGDGEHNPRFGLLSINLQKRKAVAMLPPVVFTVSGPRDCEHLWKLDVRAGFGLVTAPNARANTGGCSRLGATSGLRSATQPRWGSCRSAGIIGVASPSEIEPDGERACVWRGDGARALWRNPITT